LKIPAEYHTPEIYDAEYGSYTDDFNVFLGLKHHGLALDLACRTGRLTIALAKSGLSCMGIDASKPMLKQAKKKSEGLNISYQQGDMRNFHTSQKFDLVTLAGNSFQALLTIEGQEQMLRCVTNCIKPNGLFAFNTRNLTPGEMQTTAFYEFWHGFTDPKGHLVHVYGRQTYDPFKETISYSTKRIWPETTTITTIELRFTSLEDIQQRLDKVGFEVLDLYGDFCKTPYSEASPHLIFVCRAKP
jgi:ubiquinone/menaquinone biosynthesis C-methylase UbiE